MGIEGLEKIIEQELADGRRARVFILGQVDSVFDSAFAAGGGMAVWDSLLASSQRAGRGQMRRQWASPPGNLYAVLRLPGGGAFGESRATPFLGIICALTLRKLGWPVVLKWPNDLVLARNGKHGKAGGILLEEKGGLLFAGIGINLASAPVKMRAAAALSPAHLGAADPLALWLELVKGIFSIYKSSSNFAANWREEYEKLMLWKDTRVELEDGSLRVSGLLLGIAPSGAALVRAGNTVRECFGGNLKPAQENGLKAAGTAR